MENTLSTYANPVIGALPVAAVDTDLVVKVLSPHALAHRLPDKVEAAYRRGDLREKRMALMQAWSAIAIK